MSGVEHSECAVCGYEPDAEKIPPRYVLSLDADDRTGETIESYPFGGPLSVPFACSDDCWLQAESDGFDRYVDTERQVVDYQTGKEN